MISAAPVTRLLPVAFIISALAPSPACGPHMCLQIEEVADLCETHPFGPAPGCGAEEPQTEAECEAVLSQNPGLCVSEYVECREALRLARCGECPRECAGLVGVVACESADIDPTEG